MALPKPKLKNDWRALFHDWQEVENVPPVTFAIQGFLQMDAITLIGGLAGHGKTLCMLDAVRARLTGRPLFNYELFKVHERSRRTLYLIPESGLSAFAHRLKLFGLMEFVRSGKLYVRTLNSVEPKLPLVDPRILEAAKGADVYLDTVARFMPNGEEIEDSKKFADTLFLLQASGARVIVGAHHSPKNLGHADFLTLENVLRGSGDVGALCATCWGLYQADVETNTIVLECVKARDFQACKQFRVQARPWLDEKGHLQVIQLPGEGSAYNPQKERGKRGGRPEGPADPAKVKEALRLLEAGEAVTEIARKLGVSRETVYAWSKKYGRTSGGVQ